MEEVTVFEVNELVEIVRNLSSAWLLIENLFKLIILCKVEMIH